jgi:hypothetical protein
VRRLPALLLVAASACATLAAAPAHAYCDPELSNCAVECLRTARVWVDPRNPDPVETLHYLVPTCTTR